MADIDIRAVRADDLRYLVAVAQSGRLVAAAAALGVDHTTVARRIKSLERVLQASLIERGADGWELTEAGRAVAEHARPIQHAVEQAARAVRGARPDALTGTIRIAAPDGFGVTFVVPALTDVRRQHPDLNVELITATRELRLYQSGFDLAIGVGKPVAAKVFTELLVEYSLELYASRTYLEAHGEPQTAEDLSSHALIFYVDSMLQIGDLDLAQYLPQAAARFTSTNVLAQVEAARLGAGIALLPKYLAIREPTLRRVCATVAPLPSRFSMAIRRDSASRPSVQAVREALFAQVRSRADEMR